MNAGDRHIEVLPPDINESVQDFSVVDDRIRFGLAAVKNVGGSALDSIIEERKKSGRYTSLADFCNRIDSRRVNSRVIESLIKSGSFDSLGAKRSQLNSILEQAMDQAKAVQRDKQSGQMSLFSVAPLACKSQVTEIALPDIPEWEERKRLALEKETVGFYITGHPLDNAMSEMKTVVDSDIHNLAEWGEDMPVRVGGLIRTCKRLKSKKGDPMAFLTLEDILETVEVIVFPEVYTRCEEHLASTDPVIVQGTVQKDERGAKIIAEAVIPLQEAREKYTEQVKIRLEADKISRPRLDAVKKVIYQFHGECPLVLTMHFAGLGEVDIEVIKDLTIKPCRGLSDSLEKILGYQPLFYKKKTLETTHRKKWNNDPTTKRRF